MGEFLEKNISFIVWVLFNAHEFPKNVQESVEKWNENNESAPVILATPTPGLFGKKLSSTLENIALKPLEVGGLMGLGDLKIVKP